MKTTLIRFIITLYLLGNSYVLRSMDHFFIDTITKFQIGELNCGNFNDKYRKIVSNGCFLLNERGEWVKHGVWVFYNQETKLIDSINFENGKIVGVRKIFNSKGRLLTLIEYQNKEYPRNFKETQFFNSGASRKIIINYIQLKNDSTFKHGPSIYIRKNGNISSTTDYGDNPKPGSPIHVIVYKIDGNIQSKRIEFVGKRGYNLY